MHFLDCITNFPQGLRLLHLNVTFSWFHNSLLHPMTVQLLSHAWHWYCYRLVRKDIYLVLLNNFKIISTIPREKQTPCHLSYTLFPFLFSSCLFFFFSSFSFLGCPPLKFFFLVTFFIISLSLNQMWSIKKGGFCNVLGMIKTSSFQKILS